MPPERSQFVLRMDHIRACSRAVSNEEISELERHGNVVSGKIFTSTDSLLEVIRAGRIKHNVFLGVCYLVPGNMDDPIFFGKDLPPLNLGVFNNTLSSVTLDGSSFLRNNSMLHNVYIGAANVMIDNGVVSGNGGKFLGDDLVLCDETGSRKIYMHSSMDLDGIVKAVSSGTGRKEWNQWVKDEQGVAALCGSIIGAGNIFLKNSEISNIFCANSGNRISSSQVHNSTLLGGNCINHSVVADSLLRGSVSVENYSVVENSVLCMFSKVAVHAKVVHSVIGSYSGVESGECASSLIGPFVGFHHQSLVIATFWPEGKGNIGYGANVGSNHTGKAPDQELLAGEGTFFGLASVIKFPSNFQRAPYSLIASGVVCLPQSVTMPFSLINSSDDGNGLNEIFPGWVLSDNMFTLLRNEDKFKSRQKPDAAPVQCEIFRPDIMQLVIDARNVLMKVAQAKMYTEVQIPGIGKNMLREAARLKAIDTYSFILRWYGLRGLYRRVTKLGITQGVLPDTSDSAWTFERTVILGEGMNLSQIESLLKEFTKLDLQVASSCASSKAKDDVRGAKVIGPVYSEFHPPASSHAVCVKAMKSTRDVQETVDRLLVSKL